MLHYAQPGLGPPPGSNKGMVGKGPPTGGGKPMVVKGALPPGVVMKGHPDPAGYHQHPGPPAPGPALKGKPGGKVIIKGGPPPPGVVIGGPPPGSRGPMLIGAPPGQQLQHGAPGSLVGPPAPGQGAGGAPAPPNGPQTQDPHAQPAARSDKGGVAGGVPVMPQAQHHHQQHDQHGHKGPPGGGHSAHYNDHNKGHRDDPSTDRGGKMKGGGSKYNHQDPYNPQLHAGKGSGPPPPGGHGQAQEHRYICSKVYIISMATHQEKVLRRSPRSVFLRPPRHSGIIWERVDRGGSSGAKLQAEATTQEVHMAERE
eukprot:g5372.t1